MTIAERAARVMRALSDAGLTVATAESCTGGLIAATLTDIPGRSHAFERGFVSYTEAAKHAMLAVPRAAIARHGVVSEEVARLMAEGGLAASEADLCLAVTGNADANGDGEAGLVHFALARRNGPTVHVRRAFGDPGRAEVRAQCLSVGLELLEAHLASLTGPAQS